MHASHDAYMRQSLAVREAVIAWYPIARLRALTGWSGPKTSPLPNEKRSEYAICPAAPVTVTTIGSLFDARQKTKTKAVGPRGCGWREVAALVRSHRIAGKVGSVPTLNGRGKARRIECVMMNQGHNTHHHSHPIRFIQTCIHTVGYT